MISMIAAVCENRGIGINNRLLYRIAEDLSSFKRITMGKTLIMGRRTFESLPGVLPGRKHIVVTRKPDFKPASAEVRVEPELAPLLERYKDTEAEVFVIGGASVYEQALPYAVRLYMTRIMASPEADAYFPLINMNEWAETWRSQNLYDKKNGLGFYFYILEATLKTKKI